MYFSLSYARRLAAIFCFLSTQASLQAYFSVECIHQNWTRSNELALKSLLQQRSLPFWSPGKELTVSLFNQPSPRSSGFFLKGSLYWSRCYDAQLAVCKQPIAFKKHPLTSASLQKWLGLDWGYQAPQAQVGLLYDLPLTASGSEDGMQELNCINWAPGQQRAGLRCHLGRPNFRLKAQYRSSPQVLKSLWKGNASSLLAGKGLEMEFRHQYDLGLSSQFNFFGPSVSDCKMLFGYEGDIFATGTSVSAQASGWGIFRAFWGFQLRPIAALEVLVGQQIFFSGPQADPQLTVLSFSPSLLWQQPINWLLIKFDFLKLFQSRREANPEFRSQIRTYRPHLDTATLG